MHTVDVSLFVCFFVCLFVSFFLSKDKGERVTCLVDTIYIRLCMIAVPDSVSYIDRSHKTQVKKEQDFFGFGWSLSATGLIEPSHTVLAAEPLDSYMGGGGCRNFFIFGRISRLF
jgi:hypothetical protein